MRISKFLGLLFLLAIAPASMAQKKEKPAEKSKSIESITEKMTADQGVITTYLDDNQKLYFEIHDSLLGQPLLMVTRLAQLPSNYSAYKSFFLKKLEKHSTCVKSLIPILLRIMIQ